MFFLDANLMPIDVLKNLSLATVNIN